MTLLYLFTWQVKNLSYWEDYELPACGHLEALKGCYCFEQIIYSKTYVKRPLKNR